MISVRLEHRRATSRLYTYAALATNLSISISVKPLPTMMDLKGLFPTVTAFIAFIITLCCLFAGTKKNTLDSVNLLTVRPFTYLP